MKADSGSSDNKYHIVAEINMIPLIDVSLVLLIIFMVITPFLVRSQIQVNLPKVNTVAPSDEPPLQVMVTKEGSFFIHDKRILGHQLIKELEAMFTNAASASVLIQADKEASFERVVEVMDAARQAGIKRMGVAVIQKSGSS